jgi:transcriptional regulator with XRE-family HTH domain
LSAEESAKPDRAAASPRPVRTLVAVRERPTHPEAAAVGERVRAAREAARFTQRDVAEAGISYAYISRIESGERLPSVRALRKLARKLGVSVAWLETGSEDVAHELAHWVLEHRTAHELPDRVVELAQRVVGR